MKDDALTQSEIRSELGSDLAQVIFDYSHSESRRLLGLTPLLQGVQRKLWISPEDQLDDKIVLTSVEDNQILKACSHKTILGDNLLNSFKRETEAQVRQKLTEEFLKKGYMFEAEKRRAVELTEEHLRAQYDRYLKCLYKEFDDTLQAEVNKVLAKCNKSQQIAVVRERMRVTHEMLSKIRKEVSHIITSIYGELDQAYRAQRENMIADFNEITRRERVKLNEREQTIERQKNEALQNQYNQLLLQYMSNVVYIFCVERHRCRAEKQKIYTYFQDKISALKSKMAEQKTKMRLMKQEVAEKKDDKRVLEENLRAIIVEFRKLISFALHASTEETEFLEKFKSQFLPEPENVGRTDESMNKKIATGKFDHRRQVEEILNKHLRERDSKSSSTTSRRSDQVGCSMAPEEEAKSSSSSSASCTFAEFLRVSIKSLNPRDSTSLCVTNGGTYPPIIERRVSKEESDATCVECK